MLYCAHTRSTKQSSTDGLVTVVEQLYRHGVGPVGVGNGDAGNRVARTGEMP